LTRPTAGVAHLLNSHPTLPTLPDAVKPNGRVSRALLGALGRFGQALDQAGERLDAVVDLAVAAGGVAGVDALEDDRQLPVAEGEKEVEF
jgi:hypothetical protein